MSPRRPGGFLRNRRSSGGSELGKGWRTRTRLGGPGRTGASLISGFFRPSPDGSQDRPARPASPSRRAMRWPDPARTVRDGLDRVPPQQVTSGRRATRNGGESARRSRRSGRRRRDDEPHRSPEPPGARRRAGADSRTRQRAHGDRESQGKRPRRAGQENRGRGDGIRGVFAARGEAG